MRLVFAPPLGLMSRWPVKMRGRCTVAKVRSRAAVIISPNVKCGRPWATCITQNSPARGGKMEHMR